MANKPDKPVMPAPPAWTAIEPEDLYHARSKSGEVMSSGMLKTFRECPWQYHRKISGLVPDMDSTAYRFGRAVHSIVLEGIPAFNRKYAIGGPVNPKTGKCFAPGTKAFEDWLAENGLAMDRVVSQEEADQLVTMANMARKHGQAAAFLDFGWPELVARADLHGVPCQIRMDWFTHDADGNAALVDLKTCDDITWFESDARRYGYLHQLAFYREVVRAAAPVFPMSIFVIALEKKDPFRVGLWRIPDELLDYHAEINKFALEQYTRCKEAGAWPTGYETAREFSLDRKGA